jgi:hypothetical protein
MTKKKSFGLTTIAHAKASAKKAHAVRRAANRIQRLCIQAVSAKTHADFQSAAAKLHIALREFVQAS